MAIKTVEREIDGHPCAVTTFPASVAVDLLQRLIKFAGPAIGDFVASSDADEELDSKAIAKAVSGLALSIADPGTKILVLDLLELTAVDGKDLVKKTNSGEYDLTVFDGVFAGEMLLLGKALMFCVEVNFAGPLLFWLEGEGGPVEAVRERLARLKSPSSDEKPPST